MLSILLCPCRTRRNARPEGCSLYVSLFEPIMRGLPRQVRPDEAALFAPQERHDFRRSSWNTMCENALHL